MANIKAFVIYLAFIVIFNFFVGSLVLSNENSTVDIQSKLIISKTIAKLGEAEGLMNTVLQIALIPFLVIDLLIFVVMITTVSFSIIPAIVNTIIFVPLGIIVIFSYVLPMIRGN